jgi:cold shock CspA family protein
MIVLIDRFLRKRTICHGWNADRYFGFVLPDDGGPQLFLHITRFVEPKPELVSVDHRVRFEPGINPCNGKPEALNVTLL